MWLSMLRDEMHFLP